MIAFKCVSKKINIKKEKMSSFTTSTEILTTIVPTVSVITVLAACAFFPRPRPLDDTGLVVIGGGETRGGVASLFIGDSFAGGGGDGEGGGGGVGSFGGGGDGDGDGARGGGIGDGKFSSSSEFEGLLDNGVEFFVLGLTRLEKGE